MTYVVTENCIQCKYTDCVDVCPVDCFVEGPNFLAIDPEECIDCTLCVAECPAEAIFAEDDVPEDQLDFTIGSSDLEGDALVEVTSAGSLTSSIGTIVAGLKTPVDVSGIQASFTLGTFNLVQTTV